MAKQDITERVKTYSDACAVLGIKETLPDVGGLRPKDRTSVTAYYKLIQIARALNEGWEPDWANENERKWVPYFNFDRKGNRTAGLAHAYTSYAPASTNARIGSRLCFKTQALAEYAATQFEALYNDYILYPNIVDTSSDDTPRSDQQGAEKVGASETALPFSELLRESAAKLDAGCTPKDVEGGFILIGAQAPAEDGRAQGVIQLGGSKAITLRMLAEFFAHPETREFIQEALDRAGGIMLRRELAGGGATYEVKHGDE